MDVLYIAYQVLHTHTQQCINGKTLEGSVSKYKQCIRVADLQMILNLSSIFSKFFIMNMHDIYVKKFFSSKSCHQILTKRHLLTAVCTNKSAQVIPVWLDKFPEETPLWNQHLDQKRSHYSISRRLSCAPSNHYLPSKINSNTVEQLACFLNFTKWSAVQYVLLPLAYLDKHYA